MPTYHHGRHEHGQNFLTDRRVIAQIVELISDTSGPIIEIGPGDGALTVPLAGLGRPLTAVEIDTHQARKLTAKVPPAVDVVQGDFLHHRLPTTPHVIVGNLPFHLTTAMLRHLLHAPGWTDAILLVQWEVARRRAGVGGATMMTAQWAPWFSFTLEGRIPAAAFTPRPGVDGGLLHIRRRAEPGIARRSRKQYQALVHAVFTGRGRGLGQILARNTGLGSHAHAWLRRHGLPSGSLPGKMPTSAWIDLFETTGLSPPPRHHRRTTRRGAPRRRSRD